MIFVVISVAPEEFHEAHRVLAVSDAVLKQKAVTLSFPCPLLSEALSERARFHMESLCETCHQCDRLGPTGLSFWSEIFKRLMGIGCSSLLLI